MATLVDNIKTTLEQGVPINITVDTKVYIKLAITAIIVTAIIVLALIIFRRYK